ncbi:CysZ protein [Oceanospirillum multiglobuliferum]|uniref:Sulfate transporter CysZ n=1 Tax=Oceanospirillum multiglobuliferum TaxID=64969 RepID=A0A1T4NUF7_9GAMM|nr:sulfate transporter CysZ [Oceanospirillum multiglobuliferum]OPX55664.1 sulfate transporter CysZ [Oceanospirillum multiglobuliferum]SJZ82757.1 CysZ protein [Oceanospirillum multiglobuliferum]
MNTLFAGPLAMLAGLRIIFTPGLKRFVLVPLLSNILLLGFCIWFGIKLFDSWLDSFVQSLPSYLQFLEWLIWPLVLIGTLGFIIYGFNALTALIAAPFNGLLAEKVEQHLRAEIVQFPDETLGQMVKRSLHRELQKQWFFLKRVLLLIIISFIPGLNLLSPILWLLFSIWMLSVQYIDYPMDNHQINFHDMQARLKQKWWHTFGFGFSAYWCMLIPGINLLLMPAAVAGATWLWVHQYSETLTSVAIEDRSINRVKDI